MSLIALWQPILLASILVFVVSAVVWMVMPWHKTDFNKLPNEDAAREALKDVAPGHYIMPYAMDPEEFKKESVQQKFIDGPIAYFNVQPSGMPQMGPRMFKIFLFYVFVSALTAYVVYYHGDADAQYLDTFQLAGTVSWAAYGLAHVQDSIWFAKPWSITLKNIFDAFIYALVTAGAFAWLA